jgi:hypothetical protein
VADADVHQLLQSVLVRVVPRAEMGGFDCAHLRLMRLRRKLTSCRPGSWVSGMKVRSSSPSNWIDALLIPWVNQFTMIGKTEISSPSLGDLKPANLWLSQNK